MAKRLCFIFFFAFLSCEASFADVASATAGQSEQSKVAQLSAVSDSKLEVASNQVPPNPTPVPTPPPMAGPKTYAWIFVFWAFLLLGGWIPFIFFYLGIKAFETPQMREKIFKEKIAESGIQIQNLQSNPTQLKHELKRFGFGEMGKVKDIMFSILSTAVSVGFISASKAAIDATNAISTLQSYMIFKVGLQGFVSAVMEGFIRMPLVKEHAGNSILQLVLTIILETLITASAVPVISEINMIAVRNTGLDSNNKPILGIEIGYAILFGLASLITTFPFRYVLGTPKRYLRWQRIWKITAGIQAAVVLITIAGSWACWVTQSWELIIASDPMGHFLDVGPAVGIVLGFTAIVAVMVFFIRKYFQKGLSVNQAMCTLQASGVELADQSPSSHSPHSRNEPVQPPTGQQQPRARSESVDSFHTANSHNSSDSFHSCDSGDGNVPGF